MKFLHSPFKKYSYQLFLEPEYLIFSSLKSLEQQIEILVKSGHTTVITVYNPGATALYFNRD